MRGKKINFIISCGVLIGTFISFIPKEVAYAKPINTLHKEVNVTKNKQNSKNQWYLNNKDWYYFGENGIIKNQLKKINGYYYYFNNNGLMLTGWQKIEGDWHYFRSNGTMRIGWEKFPEGWYYLKEDGKMAIGWQQIGDKWYYLEKNGVMATGWRKIEGYWYYFEKSGSMRTGWEEIGGYWYYFRENGTMRIGWEKFPEGWYYLRSNGTMRIGWEKVQDSWYYFKSNGLMKTGWEKLKGDWYYLEENGAMTSRWKKINNIWYYFKDNGPMLFNTYVDGWRLDGNGAGHYEKGFRNPKLEGSSQLIVATTNNMSSSYCNIEVYEKNSGGMWNEVDSTYGRVGKNGLAYIKDRVQSTDTTPAGVMDIIGSFGVYDNPGTKINYMKIEDDMYWDLNNGSKYYNRLVRYNPGGDYEHLLSYKRQYEYALITDYNYNQVPNKGGAIFVHCLGRGATGGCVSMPREEMLKTLKWIDPNKKPKILVIPKYDMSKYWY
ncbi:cell wall-binding protein [Clostridium sp.]|uniref:cell wall-binding protein n=1 Tax=Clostridium sp. TaxID=1506 RepID=UPI0026346C9E|nr:cell wall-binding protein [Clostridium sp.]